MSIEVLREELIEDIRKADESKLLLVRRTIDEAENPHDYVIPQEVLEEVERRRQRYLRGEGRSYTMEEAHELIRTQYRQKRDGI